MKSHEIYYFDHAAKTSNPSPPYHCGEAGFIWISEAEFVETDWRFAISPNSLHALHGHGVVDLLNGLEQMAGPIGTGRDAIVAPSAAEEASRIFYEADRMTYGARHDLRVARRKGIDYRIVVDNREYQRTLSKLQFLSTTAARHGHGLRLRL
jgi:hypothetical protein